MDPALTTLIPGLRKSLSGYGKVCDERIETTRGIVQEKIANRPIDDRHGNKDY